MCLVKADRFSAGDYEAARSDRRDCAAIISGDTLSDFKSFNGRPRPHSFSKDALAKTPFLGSFGW